MQTTYMLSDHDKAHFYRDPGGYLATLNDDIFRVYVCFFDTTGDVAAGCFVVRPRPSWPSLLQSEQHVVTITAMRTLANESSDVALTTSSTPALPPDFMDNARAESARLRACQEHNDATSATSMPVRE